MDHGKGNRGPGSLRIACTKGSKAHYEMRNDLQSLPNGPQMIKWTMRKDIRVSIA